jgi:Neuraminidase (sialidase)
LSASLDISKKIHGTVLHKVLQQEGEDDRDKDWTVSPTEAAEFDRRGRLSDSGGVHWKTSRVVHPLSGVVQMNLREAIKLNQFAVMRRRGLRVKDPQIDYQRLNYHAYERYMSRIEKQNERLIETVESLKKQTKPPKSYMWKCHCNANNFDRSHCVNCGSLRNDE